MVGASNGGNSLFKQGGGTLTYSGQQTNTMAGATYVQEGTLVLNKQGDANVNAIRGTLVIGDGRGGDNADRVAYGPLAGSDQISDTQNIFVRTTGEYDLSAAQAFSSELQLLSFGANSSIALSLLGVTAQVTQGIDAAATVAALQFALDSMYGPGNFAVSAVDPSNNKSFLIRFAGQLANTNLPPFVVTAGDASISTLRDGAGNAVQVVTPSTVTPPTSIGFQLNGTRSDGPADCHGSSTIDDRQPDNGS